MKLSAVQLRSLVKEELSKASKDKVNESFDPTNHPDVSQAITDLTEALIYALTNQAGPSGSNFDPGDADAIKPELEGAIQQAVREIVPQFWS